LGLSVEQTIDLENAVLHKQELLRPGFVRVSLGYYWTDEDIDFLVEAVKFVASEGWKLMPTYFLFPDTAEWKHSSVKNKTPTRRWIHNVNLSSGKLSFPRFSESVGDAPDRSTLISLAEGFVADAVKVWTSPSAPAASEEYIISSEAQELGLQWFASPVDVIKDLKSGKLDAGLDHLQHIAGHVNLLPSYNGTLQVPQESCPFVPKESSDVAAAISPTKDAEIDESALASVPVLHCELSEKERLKKLFPKVPKSLTRPVGEAIREFDMIQEGDRVLIGLSGGKDSLTMLHVLIAMQKRAPINFEIAAVTMNPNFPGFDPRPLIPYMKTLGIPYYFESQELMEAAQTCDPDSICSWCSRMKRLMKIPLHFSSSRRWNIVHCSAPRKVQCACSCSACR
jgi:hypothetical protein